ncbi:MAG: LolA family protein [Streptomyces sp.]|uniref:LolA family protein n=1 Tax=Streptomyces sp. TaxID=1931 RepID=UPI003D6B216A
MAQIQPRKPGRKAVRYGIPAAIAGVAAATVGLVPALASTGDPDLPKISANELVAKMAASDTQHMSGTVKISTDLGLPAMPGMSGGSGKHGGLFGGGPHGEDGQRGEKGGGGDKGSTAAPQDKLMELASGEHTLRVAADGPDKQRVSIVDDASEYSFVHNADEVWAYDSGTNSAYHATAPKGAGKHHGGKHGKHHGKKHGMKQGKGLGNVTPQEAAKQALKAVDDTTSVSVDGTAKVAGRDAYQLVIKPKGAPHSTVESVRIAVDADNGTPLKFTLTPKGGGKAAIDAAYTKVDFGKPAAGTFRFKPPKGAKVTEHEAGDKAHHEKHGKHGKADPEKHFKGLKDFKELKKSGKGERPDMSGLNTLGEGWGAVAELKAPGGAMMGGKQGAEEGTDSPQAKKLLNSFTDEVKGDFGTGRVFSTRLVNALMTDDGTVYVGAVSKEGLIKAAEAAAK